VKISASYVGVLLAAIGLGSIPFGLLIARYWSGADVRAVGSGNIGATNVLRASGPAPAIVTLLMDAGKGAGAVLLARAVMAAASAPGAGASPGPAEAAAGLFAAPGLDAWAALAAVAGHMFSPWLGFRGGKGVATAAGALLALSPPLAGAGFGVFAVVFALSRKVSLSSIAACLAAAVLSATGWIAGSPAFVVVAGICALIVIRHRANIGRLLRGEEPRLQLRRSA
jgi:glycerol-3-phosphate acyltransferase PlsY